MSDYPSKTINLGYKKYLFHGISEDDPYFSNLSDNFEPEFTLLCEYLLHEDSICLDIGANIGVKSLIMANYAEKGRVCAIEASPTVARILRLNVEKNGLSNVIVEEKAVGDGEKTVQFVDSSCYGHIDRDGKSGLPVEMTTIDAISECHGFSKIDFIKIDIEGNEQPALMTGMQTINKFEPIIYMEFNSWCQLTLGGCNPAHFLDWLLDNFKAVFTVSKGDRNLLSRLERENKNAFLWRNMRRDGFVSDLIMTNNSVHNEVLTYLTNTATPGHTISGDDEYEFDSGYQNKLVEPQDVINAYRMILGREPESQQVIMNGVGTITVGELRSGFIFSEEFRAQLAH